MPTEIRVLGQLEVWSDGAPVALRSSRQKRLVAALALHAGALVPWDELLELVWGDDPPTYAANRLRRFAHGLGNVATVEMNDLGCGLHDHVDLRSFEELVAQERLREALALWRGPALAGITGGVLGELAYQLDMRRAEVWEQCADSLSDLTELVEAFPLRERSVELLMRAQHDAGLDKEALDTYHRFRARLLVEQRREQSRELHQLVHDIETARPKVPEQVPADVACFVGRAEQLDALDPNGVTLISGIGGVGKTALAVRWANSVRDSYPDGQLYVNLCGYHSSQPVSANTALKTFLQALGAPRIPDRLADRVRLFRSLLENKQVLVVLDNAATRRQVEPLLAPGCTVVITSRNAFLPHTRHIDLNVLSAEESEELLKLVLGEQRVAAEPDAARELANACGHLPLTLRVVASDLAGRTGLRIADAVADLVQPTVEGAFNRSYEALPTAARALLRYLSCVPASDVTVDMMSALLGAPADEPLAALDAAHLVIRHHQDRYRLHDLVRHYAFARSSAEDSVPSREAVFTRYLDHLITTADAAGRLVVPFFQRLPRPEPVGAFTSEADASAWFAAELQNLMATVAWAYENGFDHRCVHLVDALRSSFWISQDTVDWIRAGRIGLASAQRCDDMRLRAAMHCNFGMAAQCRGEAAEARLHNQRALALFEELDDWSGTATMLINLGISHELASELTTATKLWERALSLGVEQGCVDTQILALGNTARAMKRIGRPRDSIEPLERCLLLAAEDRQYHRAYALSLLGESQIDMGELDQAEANLQEAARMRNATHSWFLELYELVGLGFVHVRAGRCDLATNFFELVVSEATRLSSNVLLGYALLGLADSRRGDRSAVDHGEHALRVHRELADAIGEVGALVGLAQAHLALAEPAAAAEWVDQAVALAGEHECNAYTGRVMRARGSVFFARREHDQARKWIIRARDQHRSQGLRLHEVEDLVQLAQVSLATGDARTARHHESEATPICREQVGTRAPDVLDAMWLRTTGRHQPS